MFYRQIAIDNIDRVVASANASRSIIHSGLTGRLREIIVGDLLKPWLNPHLKTATGVIIDHYGNQSKQIDVIVYDERITPPILLNNQEGFVPCHAVVATIEVKSTLSSGTVKDAIENARSVKLLKYDYDKIPVAGEAGFVRYFNKRLLDQLKDEALKDLLEYVLFAISSPACYLFALTSDLTDPSNTVKEISRLDDAVAQSNQGRPMITIPISGLCIMDRLYYYCTSVVPYSGEGVFSHIVANKNELTRQAKDRAGNYFASHGVMLRFLSDIVNTCCVYAHQRSRIPLEVYLEPVVEEVQKL